MAKAVEETKHDVHACVAAVMRLMGKQGISKDGVNESQRFSFRGIDQVLDALNGPLVATGLNVFATVKDVVRTERTTSKGGSMTNTLLTVEYRLVSKHDGSEFTTTFVGEASDSGDKGASKALSMAFKYFAFQTFCIPVEGMDDSDLTTPPASMPSKAPSKPSKASKAEEVPEAAPEADEAPETAQEPETAFTFEDGLQALKACTTADELAALKPKLAVFAKHKDFAKKMKSVFIAKTEELSEENK